MRNNLYWSSAGSLTSARLPALFAVHCHVQDIPSFSRLHLLILGRVLFQDESQWTSINPLWYICHISLIWLWLYLTQSRPIFFLLSPTQHWSLPRLTSPHLSLPLFLTSNSKLQWVRWSSQLEVVHLYVEAGLKESLGLVDKLVVHTELICWQKHWGLHLKNQT